MDIRKEILKAHSKAQTNKIVTYIGNNPSRFNELIALYFEGPYRITQRASWPLSICVINHPRFIRPHLKKTLNFLKKPGIHDAVKRSTMRFLQFIEIPKAYHGQVIGICFDFLQNKKEPVAIKVFSMTVLLQLIKNEPGLKKELQIIIEDHMPYASAAFISRGKKVLREINKQDK